MPPDDADERPGSAYLETLRRVIGFASHPVTVWDRAGKVEEFRGTGDQLIAEVLEALATYGLLVGEEHHHKLTDDEALRYAEWMVSLLPPDSTAARRYGPDGLGARGVLTYAGLEFVYPIALRAASGDGETQGRLRRGRRALIRWMEDRDRRT